jgi:hypothetical protein
MDRKSIDEQGPPVTGSEAVSSSPVGSPSPAERIAKRLKPEPEAEEEVEESSPAKRQAKPRVCPGIRDRDLAEHAYTYLGPLLYDGKGETVAEVVFQNWKPIGIAGIQHRQLGGLVPLADVETLCAGCREARAIINASMNLVKAQSGSPQVQSDTPVHYAAHKKEIEDLLNSQLETYKRRITDHARWLMQHRWGVNQERSLEDEEVAFNRGDPKLSELLTTMADARRPVEAELRQAKDRLRDIEEKTEELMRKVGVEMQARQRDIERDLNMWHSVTV